MNFRNVNVWRDHHEQDMAHHGLLKWLRQTSSCRCRRTRRHLIATPRKVDELQELSAAHPETVKTTALDVTEKGSASATVQLAESAFGGLDVLVNNAGFGFMGAVEEATPEEYRPIFDTNVFGLIETTRAALPALRKQRGAWVVNLSSGVGIAGGRPATDITTPPSSRSKACAKP